MLLGSQVFVAAGCAACIPPQNPITPPNHRALLCFHGFENCSWQEQIQIRSLFERESNLCTAVECRAAVRRRWVSALAGMLGLGRAGVRLTAPQGIDLHPH